MQEDITIVDISQHAGVSISTVSRVLNNHPDVSQSTRQKVSDVIEKLSYVPNNSARNLKRESMKAVAVIVKGFTNPFFTRMLEVIQGELEAWQYMMLLHQVDPNQDEVNEAISLVKEKKPRGLIFMGGNFQQNREKLAILGIPFVMTTITASKGVDRSVFSSVSIDDFAEAYKVTDIICKSGHRKVAAIGFLPEDKSISRLRIAGFQQALEDNGCPHEVQGICYAGEFSRAAGYRAAKELLQKTTFTCLFCISDMMALGAIRAIHEAGLSVPHDISVVGFDGIDAGHYSIPSLATVKQPDVEMAHESIKLLMNCLKKGAPHEHKIFRAEFLAGESFKSLPGWESV